MKTEVNEINYKTVLAEVTVDGERRRIYRGLPIHQGTVRAATIIKNAAKKHGIKKDLLTYHANVLFDELGNAILNGERLEIDDFLTGHLNITGVFPSADAPWDPLTNKMVAHFSPKGTLKKSVDGMTGRNVTEGNHVILKRIVDTVAKTEGVIAQGTNVAVIITGDNLEITTGATDEGVWIEDLDGNVLATATVTDSGLTTIDCTFATLPEDGEYRLCVAARGGLSLDYGVSLARKNVTIATINS